MLYCLVREHKLTIYANAQAQRSTNSAHVRRRRKYELSFLISRLCTAGDCNVVEFLSLVNFNARHAFETDYNGQQTKHIQCRLYARFIHVHTSRTVSLSLKLHCSWRRQQRDAYSSVMISSFHRRILPEIPQRTKVHIVRVCKWV